MSKKDDVVAKELAQLNLEKKNKVSTAIRGKIAQLSTEITERNQYMDLRDRILYDPEAIFEGVDIKPGFDKTKFNWLSRAKEIHTFQVMGRGFNINTRYDKEDTSLFRPGTPDRQGAELKNTQKAVKANNAKQLLQGAIDDNGGKSIFMNMAAVASGYGVGLIKKYIEFNEKEEDQLKIVSIESPQNFVAGWSSTNFRERDFDAIVYKISVDSANRLYGSKLESGQVFQKDSQSGLDENTSNNLPDQTSQDMITVVDFVGMVPGINEGNTFHALIVGNYLVGYETREKYFPKYYLFQNRERLRRPWGLSDISDNAIDLQRTYIGLMSDNITLLKKMFPKILAKGFEDINLPQSVAGEIQVFPVGFDQDMSIMQFQPGTYPYKQMVDEVKEGLFRELGLGRVMIDDPTVSFESNQALMTGMKSTIDIAEDKQSRWKETLRELFEDILQDLITINPKVKDMIGDEYTVDIEWPSVLRKEDAAYNTTLLNDVRAGLISLETYLEKKGYTNVPEEIDRIKAEMQDPILGAVLSANLRMINQMNIQPVQPQPQGQQPTNAPLTTDQNQGTQPMSMAGSGAPAVSPQGAMNTMNQNMGA